MVNTNLNGVLYDLLLLLFIMGYIIRTNNHEL